jgi:outer membrane immunogenic protein
VAATLGYLVNPTTKIYGKAGYGWVREHSTYTCGGSLDGCLLTSVESATISETRGGFDAGVGLTWMFQRNWDLFVEYDHMWLGSKNATYNFPTSSADFGVTNKESFSKLLVGIDYRFGGPVVAKY